MLSEQAEGSRRAFFHRLVRHSAGSGIPRVQGGKSRPNYGVQLLDPALLHSLQEYWAGEIVSPGLPPEWRVIERGAGSGLQSYFLLFLDAPWVHSKPDSEMEAPRFSAERPADYIHECRNRQAVVTMNLGIDQEGTIGPRAAACMADARREIRGGSRGRLAPDS
jgi:hypothetical protein